MLSQISQVLDVEPVANVSPKWNVNRPIQGVLAAFQIGDHGPEYQFEKPSPAEHEALLNCGCSLFFPVPTMPGELLLCARHDDWFKSNPVETKPKPVGEHYVKCHSCPREYGPILRAHAYTSARRHSYGKNGNKNSPHHVSIGKPSPDGIVWTEYKRRDN